MELKGRAVSPEMVEAAKAYLAQGSDIQNRLMLAHARMDLMRSRQKLLERDGGSKKEKKQLMREMREKEEQILRDYHLLLETEKEIESTIQRVQDPALRMVLEMRCIHHMAFFAIAERMDKDERHIYRLYYRGVETVAVIHEQCLSCNT